MRGTSPHTLTRVTACPLRPRILPTQSTALHIKGKCVSVSEGYMTSGFLQIALLLQGTSRNCLKSSDRNVGNIFFLLMEYHCQVLRQSRGPMTWKRYEARTHSHTHKVWTEEWASCNYSRGGRVFIGNMLLWMGFHIHSLKDAGVFWCTSGVNRKKWENIFPEWSLVNKTFYVGILKSTCLTDQITLSLSPSMCVCVCCSSTFTN